MIAYLTKTRTGFELRICAKPCNGPEFANAPTIQVANKRAAAAYCKANNIKLHNF
jgi:hypothetical protein